MLDHLSVIANHIFNLGIEEHRVCIRNKHFRKNIAKTNANLADFLKRDTIDTWIDIMADMRHQAAHKVIAIPRQMVAHSDESEMSDEHIGDIIKNETPSLSTMPNKNLEAVRSLMIYNWRMTRMQTLAQGIIFINKGDNSYFRNPATSIDYDLERLNAIIDAFLFALSPDL